MSSNSRSVLQRHPPLFAPHLTRPSFVQWLANPVYVNFLAAQKLFDKPEFVAYLGYLQYFSDARYAKFLSHPGPTLRALELLQQERFRHEILAPGLMSKLVVEGQRNAVPPGPKPES